MIHRDGSQRRERAAPNTRRKQNRQTCDAGWQAEDGIIDTLDHLDHLNRQAWRAAQRRSA
jgi:hypothetical protein